MLKDLSCTSDLSQIENVTVATFVDHPAMLKIGLNIENFNKLVIKFADGPIKEEPFIINLNRNIVQHANTVFMHDSKLKLRSHEHMKNHIPDTF